MDTLSAATYCQPPPPSQLSTTLRRSSSRNMGNMSTPRRETAPLSGVPNIQDVIPYTNKRGDNTEMNIGPTAATSDNTRTVGDGNYPADSKWHDEWVSTVSITTNYDQISSRGNHSSDGKWGA